MKMKNLQLSSWQDRIINLVVGGFTSVVVLVSTDFRCLEVKHPAEVLFFCLRESSSTWACC